MGFNKEKARKNFEAYLNQNSFDTDTDLTVQFNQILNRYSEIADVTQKYTESVSDEGDVMEYTRSAESKQWVEEHREAAYEAREIHNEIRELLEEMELDVIEEMELDLLDGINSPQIKFIDHDAVAERLGEDVAVITSQTFLLSSAVVYTDNEDDSEDGVLAKISSRFSR